MAQTSGFFDALEVEGVYDRTYSSKDYCDNLATIINNGVRYSEDDDLKITAASNMHLTLAAGRAWIKGHYFYSDTAESNLLISTAPTGELSRIDAVVLRLDTSEEVRAIYPDIIKGAAAVEPVAPTLTRNDTIYEICLAYVRINANVREITDANITDMRSNNSVCGWASSVTPAIMSMLQEYTWREVLTSNTTTITFNIPQYDADNKEAVIINVYTNGILDIEGVDYNRNGNILTFTNTRLTGSEIIVKLKKSIEADGDIEKLTGIVEDLQNDMNALNVDQEYIYVCTGVNDNIKISNICQKFLNNDINNSILKIRVVGGNISATTPFSGNGSAATPYVWFQLGKTITTNRRVIVDFSNSGQISPAVAAGGNNVIFSGKDVNITGAAVHVVQREGATSINIFDGLGDIFAQDCYFRLYTASNSYIAQSGTFTNCRGFITCKDAGAYCFPVAPNCAVIINGGEYRAYTGKSDSYSAIICVWYANTAGIAESVKAPKIPQSGYIQTWFCSAPSGYAVLNHCITQLTNNGNSVTNVNNIPLTIYSN